MKRKIAGIVKNRLRYGKPVSMEIFLAWELSIGYNSVKGITDSFYIYIYIMLP